MRRFRDKTLQILVATDVAARGIDVVDITHVINYNLPDEIENYTHRSGRTARAGKKGQSIVLVTSREVFKIQKIENKIRANFTKGVIPGAKEICDIQLKKLVDKIITTEVKEGDIEDFIPTIMDSFESFSKEEIIKKFISNEFNQLIDYYQNARDLNLNANSNSDRNRRDRKQNNKGRRDRESRRSDENKTRFFVNLGRKDGLNPGGLLRIVCDSSKLDSSKVGRIDILSSFSFFEADNELVSKILKEVNGAQYEGHKVSVEVTKDKASRRRNRGGNANNRARRNRSRRR